MNKIFQSLSTLANSATSAASTAASATVSAASTAASAAATAAKVTSNTVSKHSGTIMLALIVLQAAADIYSKRVTVVRPHLRRVS